MGIKDLVLIVFTVYIIGSVINTLYNLYLYYYSDKEYFKKVRKNIEKRNSNLDVIAFIVSLVVISIIYSWRGIHQNINHKHT